MHIDPKFIDVDLDAEAKRLGILKGYAAAAGQRFTDATGKCYGDVYPVLSDAERTAAIERLDAEGGSERLITRIFDQDGEGSCVGNATTQGQQVLQAKQFGKDRVVQLSAISMYKQIGSSPNSGADIGDARDAATETGFVPLDTPENRQRFGDCVMPHIGFRTAWPANWKETAKKFRVRETLVIRSIAEMETALINGHPIVVGRAGHSILYCRPTLKNGRGVIYVNSWGKWGSAGGDFDYGFGMDTNRLVSSSAQWCWALCSIVVPDWQVAA